MTMRKWIGAIMLAAIALPSPATSAPPRRAAHAAAPRACPPLVLDLETGLLNGVSPAAGKAQIRRAFPCHDGESTEAVVANYGGGLFYNQHAVYFYTWRKFLDVRSGFTGTMRPALLGQTRDQIATRYRRLVCARNVTYETRPGWACGPDAPAIFAEADFIAMRWGCLMVRYQGNRVDSLWLFPELETDPLLANGCTTLLEPH